MASLVPQLHAGRPLHAAHSVAQAGGLTGLQAGSDPTQQYQCRVGRVPHLALVLHSSAPDLLGEPLRRAPFFGLRLRFNPAVSAEHIGRQEPQFPRSSRLRVAACQLVQGGNRGVAQSFVARRQGREEREGAGVWVRFHANNLALFLRRVISNQFVYGGSI